MIFSNSIFKNPRKKPSVRIRFTIIGALLIVLTGKSVAGEVGMALGNDALYINGDFQLPETPYYLGGGYLYHDNSKHLQHLDFLTRGNRALFNLPVRVDLGLRLLNLSTKGADGQALAIGMAARSNIPAVPGLATEASLHLAPKVLSFDDVENVIWTELEVNYRIIRQAEARFGYRYIQTKVDSNNQDDGKTLDSGIFLGFRFLF